MQQVQKVFFLLKNKKRHTRYFAFLYLVCITSEKKFQYQFSLLYVTIKYFLFLSFTGVFETNNTHTTVGMYNNYNIKPIYNTF